jgi:hypothetical protein
MKIFIAAFFLSVSSVSFSQDSLYSMVIASQSNNYSAKSGALDKYHHVGQTGLTETKGFFTYLDSLGNILHNQYYHVSNDNGTTRFQQLIASTDDKFVLCGSSHLNATNKWIGNLTKVDSTGTVIWSKQLRGTSTNSFNLTDVSESADSTYLAIGVDQEAFNATFFEIDRNGNTLNSFTITSSAGYFSFTRILEISDTSVVLIGSENAPFQNPKAIVICCSKTGTIYWTNSIDNASFSRAEQGINSIWISTIYNNELALTSIHKSGQFNSLMTYGFNNFPIENTEICVIKDSTILLSYGYEHMSNAILLKTVVGSSSVSNLFPKFCPTDLIKRENDGAYVLGNGPLYGIKKNNLFDHSAFIRIDSSFSASLCLFDNASSNATNVPVTNSALTSLSIGATGTVTDLNIISETGNLDHYMGCVDFLGAVTENELNLLSIYPNPGNGKLTIENSSNQVCQLVVRNALGVLLHQEELDTPNKSVDLGGFASGYYVIELIESETGRSIGKQVYIQN